MSMLRSISFALIAAAGLGLSTVHDASATPPLNAWERSTPAAACAISKDGGQVGWVNQWVVEFSTGDLRRYLSIYNGFPTAAGAEGNIVNSNNQHPTQYWLAGGDADYTWSLGSYALVQIMDCDQFRTVE
jgi:hypothetical protein